MIRCGAVLFLTLTTLGVAYKLKILSYGDFKRVSHSVFEYVCTYAQHYTWQS